jgi:hypothetical protein
MKKRAENDNFMNLDNMSITELKQLLSCVNQDINSIKRQKKIEIIEPSEYDIAKILSNFVNPKILITI